MRAIASQLSISRQSVAVYANKLRHAHGSFEELRQLPDADMAAIVYAVRASADENATIRRKVFNTQVPYFITELKRTGVTSQLLWQEYSREHEDHFGYTQFCILLKEAIQAHICQHVPCSSVGSDSDG